MTPLSVDIDLLRAFENGLDPRHPERSDPPAKVLGFGEISTVLEIAGLDNLACKRMPMFRSLEEADAYQALYRDYVDVLKDHVGLRVPGGEVVRLVDAPRRRVVVYIVQPKLPVHSIAHKVIHRVSNADALRLLSAVLAETAKVFAFNSRNEGRLEVGFDAQISNWAVEGFDPDEPTFQPGTALTYFDTSTPLVRKEGRERLDPELMLRSAPWFLVWILRLLFVKDVMTRYYDFRKVAMDIAANFIKEQRADLLPELVERINDFYSREMGAGGIKPMTVEEVRAYYREDALIWRLYLAFRKVDRSLRTIAGGHYPYILPERIVR